jgi:methanogenic corrinoid protein MtbC1
VERVSFWHLLGTLAAMAGLNDPRRRRALARAGLLEPHEDETFDRLAEQVKESLGVPVATVTIVEADRQLFPGAVGLDEPWLSSRETPIAYSFCQHCVLSAQPFLVDDARRHPLVKDSPAIEELGVVAYAGVPIVSSDGVVLGTICAIDHEPRGWSEDDLAELRRLASEALQEIARRTTAETVSGGLNISALARRTGVAADTLRKWELRYGVIRPFRTSGGQRRYTEQDLARVEWLRDRLGEGYRIGEAAALLGSGAEEEPRRSPDDFVAGILAAAASSDAQQTHRLVGQAFALHPVARVLEEIVEPALRRVGDEWANGELSVAQEHLVTEAIRARLEGLLVYADEGVRGRAVAACAPGERHDIGLMCVALMLRADGWQVTYLGADTPVADAVELARQIGANVLAFSVARGELRDALAEALAAESLPPELTVVVGGQGADAPLVERIGARSAPDARAVVDELRTLAA